MTFKSIRLLISIARFPILNYTYQQIHEYHSFDNQQHLIKFSII